MPVTLPAQESETVESTPLEPRVDGGFSEQNAVKVENTPIENFESEQGYPMIADLLDDKQSYSFDVWDNKESLETIDTFLKDELSTKNYKLTTENYQKEFDRLKERLGITGDETKENIEERILGFIRAFEKVRQGQEKKARREVLNKLYAVAYGKDYNARDLELLVHESYLKKEGLWL